MPAFVIVGCPQGSRRYLDANSPTRLSPIVHDIGVDAAERTSWIVERARGLGFDLCGVAPAEAFEELSRLPEWLERGHAGEMNYLRDPRRNNPRDVVAGARSVIVASLNYRTRDAYSTEVPASHSSDAPRGWISRYAWGDDYHDVLRNKLNALVAAMHETFTDPFEARAYVDTGPIVERVAAHHAGLGWLAKNTMLINEELGSWLFLGVIVTTLELEPSVRENDALPADLCGQCRLCIDACPTEAITEPYLLDARRCISYLTIELRGAIPEELRPGIGRMVFGCDICQDVCPWNRNAPVTSLAEFLPRALVTKQNGAADAELADVAAQRETLFSPRLEALASMTQEEFSEEFRGSAVKRTKWRGLVRNACVALGNCAVALDSPEHAQITAVLQRLAASPDAVIVEHARWALARLRPSIDTSFEAR